MNPWWGQLAKEYRLGRGGAIGALIALFLYLGIGVYASWRMGNPETFLAFCAFALMMHVLYMAGYMCVSLIREQRTLHLWLQTPLPAYKLLLAKLLNGWGALAFSLFIISAITLLSGTMVVNLFELDPELTWRDVISTGILIDIHILLIALYIGIGLTFLWAIYLVVSKSLGKVSGNVIGICLFFFLPWLMSKWEGTGLFHALFIWGKVDLNFSDVAYVAFRHVYIGYYFYHFLLALLLLFIASWLIERKVEV
ncbi:hypothetical protein SAMN04488137_0705 [Fictibacillus solisalsi]|uniref:ABC-2 type transport system permease protein n=1 Tax=Fictibacillus solisalsi TaxID=459525 RepID=A0A1G9U5H5_9BACL|nr:hypothetical protein [Fictibacillus solisalsi]SDM55063.1 hypothetical protein SAMN04488137_0705 [Fictibacillus solisalsi]